jgi:hypothetical protein
MSDSTNIAGSGGRSLIYVHGRDVKPAAEDLFDIAIAAIAAGIERDCFERIDEFHSVSKRIAYYGDIGNEFLQQNGSDYDSQLDIGDRKSALNQLRTLQRRKDFGVSCYDRLPGKTAISEFVADVVAPLLGSVGLSSMLIAKVAPDVAEYWNKKDPRFRDAVRDRVSSAIRAGFDRGDDIILISHGSGCIATYDALWQLSHDEEWVADYANMKVNTWMTLGSPLGDSMVRRRLLGAEANDRKRYPINVVTWHNVSAEDDYLCHDNTCADDYKPMLKQRQVSSIRDYRIYNLAVRYGKSNPHSSVGYLIHPRVTSIVTEWLTQTAAGTTHKSIL